MNVLRFWSTRKQYYATEPPVSTAILKLKIEIAFLNVKGLQDLKPGDKVVVEVNMMRSREKRSVTVTKKQ